ncbi:ceroid-lipofuscinosis neuronal protein 5 homolog [Patella vulgata]|uniref:ceroid-lipofuscinosis neuronal protein 5 homolog n=1 Tax=Patella vulgata TaxID=6465 RepID=UPI0024A9C074|nr:ceroid-lipofuscinosis neuronal protein 5 homolog [Patella vulgata]
MQSIIFFLLFLVYVNGDTWPVAYKRYESRPTTNPYCKAGVLPFCPTGRESNTMPKFNATDRVEVFALKAPVWEFKFGKLLADFNIMHDAIGFNNLNTGLNYTMEWYELFQLFNCTFAHLLTNNTLKWCNQGASCIYDGINDKHWSQNGTLVKVAEITGEMFNDFGNWSEWDNNTGIYYETWTVASEPGEAGKLWFAPNDCASFVLRAFQKMADLGAEFNQSVHLNYTKIFLYSEEPIHLGPASVIFGPGSNQTLTKDILLFYSHFQSHQDVGHLLESLLQVYIEVVAEHRFYFFYNFEYWLLPMVPPYVRLTYDEIPLPTP